MSSRIIDRVKTSNLFAVVEVYYLNVALALFNTGQLFPLSSSLTPTDH